MRISDWSSDVCSSDLVYVQAKRYAPGLSVGRPEIQAFTGSLVGLGASKGVFVTTSTFTSQAIEFTSCIDRAPHQLHSPSLLRIARVGAAERDCHAGQLRALRIGRVAGNGQLLDQLLDFEAGQLAAPPAPRSEGHQQQGPGAQDRKSTVGTGVQEILDRKSTRLNSSH